MNTEITKEDDKDEDKASLPDTEVGEVEDFTQQQLADFEAENEDEDEDEPESKKPKYSAVVKKRTRPKVNSVLYIQAGEKDRAPIEKGCFKTLKSRQSGNCQNGMDESVGTPRQERN